MPKKERRGLVVSDAMDKTIVVKVVENRSHKKYSKIQQRSVKFKAHDELNVAKVGQRVLIQESSPYSKTKTWRLVEILSADVDDTAAQGASL
jgi:small subunit ribosomal protein S17